jgi:predicted DNA-binding protein
VKTSSIHVRLPEPLRKALEARAEREGETPSEVVREALEGHLGPHKLPKRSDD